MLLSTNVGMFIVIVDKRTALGMSRFETADVHSSEVSGTQIGSKAGRQGGRYNGAQTPRATTAVSNQYMYHPSPNHPCDLHLSAATFWAATFSAKIRCRGVGDLILARTGPGRRQGLGRPESRPLAVQQVDPKRPRRRAGRKCTCWAAEGRNGR